MPANGALSSRNRFSFRVLFFSHNYNSETLGDLIESILGFAISRPDILQHSLAADVIAMLDQACCSKCALSSCN